MSLLETGAVVKTPFPEGLKAIAQAALLYWKPAQDCPDPVDDCIWSGTMDIERPAFIYIYIYIYII
jgi:hypothetical protein